MAAAKDKLELNPPNRYATAFQPRGPPYRTVKCTEPRKHERCDIMRNYSLRLIINYIGNFLCISPPFSPSMVSAMTNHTAAKSDNLRFLHGPTKCWSSGPCVFFLYEFYREFSSVKGRWGILGKGAPPGRLGVIFKFTQTNDRTREE